MLLVVDEAQRLNPDLLEQIRLLSNIELQYRKLINIFFVGQPEFSEMLMEDRNRAVRQRITVSYHIEPLSEIETRQYIKHRLNIAGTTREIFSKDAVSKIYAFSAGYPRLINIICDHAMLTGYASGLKTINQKVIKECERELQITLAIGTGNGEGRQENTTHQNKSAARQPDKPSIKRRTGLNAAMIMLLVFGVYFFSSQKTDDALRWKRQEIAPQKYQDPSQEEMKRDQGGRVQVSELKDVEPIKESPAGEHSVLKQIQSPANENAADPKTRQPPDKNTMGIQVQQPATSDEKLKKIAGSETPETAPLLERKFIIYFKHSSNEFPDQSFETLNRIADFMLNSPKTTIDIKGYSDSTGTDGYNGTVSQFLANTVKIFLIGKGVESAKINTVGLGSKKPIATIITEEGRRKNRWVELELIVQN